MAYELFVLALTIVTGFVANAIFDRTRISHIIILMLFGFMLGPVFGILDVSEGSILKSILPFIAILALVILLFDGGLEFDIFAVAKSIPRSMLFTILVFGLGIVLVAALLAFGLGWPPLSAVLLATVAGGTSAAIVIAMVENTATQRETKSLLTVESTMTDALCIISAMVVVQVITAGQAPSPGTVVGLLIASFTTAIIVGVVAALSWIAALSRLHVERYSYLLLLALVFVIYTISEEIGGNGGFAVFTFGIVLGNAPRIGKLIRKEWENPMSHVMRSFQEEMTFFVRTFFFVYIGLLLSLDFFTVSTIALSVALTGIYLISRYAIQRLLLADLPGKDRGIIVTMGPRGLAAAVLATIPLTNGISIPSFQELVFAIILASNIAATIGIFVLDRNGNAGTLKNAARKNGKR